MSKSKDDFIEEIQEELEKFTRETTDALNKIISAVIDANKQDPDKIKEIEKFREEMKGDQENHS